MKKPGRNDLCHCGSGKKYKSCCLKTDMPASSTGFKRKLAVKVISAGGSFKKEPQAEEATAHAPKGYAGLMERSFGEALRGSESQPPLPAAPDEYLPKPDEQ